MTAPFIPRDRIVPGVDYRGYVAYGNGLLRKDLATFTGFGANDSLRLKAIPQHTPPEMKAEPVVRRTPDQRVDSMAQRILNQFNKGGLSESVFREVQAAAWEAGKPISYDQARELAARYLGRAEMEWKAQHYKDITKPDPYRPRGEERPEPEKRQPGRLVFGQIPGRGNQPAHVPAIKGGDS